MPVVRKLQSSFNSGVVDPLAASRVDLEQYYRGVKTGTNVVPSPRGGMRRRPGSLEIGQLQQTITRITDGVTPTAPRGGTAANADDGDTGY